MLIEKVDERTWHPGHQIPIVYVKITSGKTLPSSKEEYDQLPFLKTNTSYFDFSVFPDDLAEELRRKYPTDQHGYLNEYRISLITTSRRTIPSKLIYLGNYQGTVRPAGEFVHDIKMNIPCIFWKEFEEKLIDKYLLHNQQRRQ